MNITCHAEDYSIEEKEDMIVVSNKVYDSNSILLFLVALLEMLLPDTSTYRLPKSIIIPQSNQDQPIIIDKKLNVKGTDQYEYVFINEQLKKWKRSYLITNIITILAILILFFLFIYNAFGDEGNKLALIPAAVILILTVIAIVRLWRNLREAKKIKTVTLKNEVQND